MTCLIGWVVASAVILTALFVLLFVRGSDDRSLDDKQNGNDDV